MQEEGLDVMVLKKLHIAAKESPDLKEWKEFVARLKSSKNEIRIALVGKYVELFDSYKSIIESLTHAGAMNNVKVNVVFVCIDHYATAAQPQAVLWNLRILI